MVSEVQPLPQPRALSLGHFRPIAVNGFGDGRNTYAYSCAWFNDHVYIGTNRNVFAVTKKRIKIDLPVVIYPVPVPEREEDIDLRGQIWRYNPRTEVWQRVYRSPFIRGLEGREVPLGLGFRNMVVFQGRSDPKPAIYTIPNCGSLALGPVVLRSVDGLHFEPVSEPGLGLEDTSIISYRGSVSFKGRLFVTPAASRGNTCTALNMTVLCSDDPARGRWEVSNPDGFKDPTNHGIFDMGVCGNFLYVGTINPRQGFQVWKTDGEGPPPHRWAKVLDRGADRGPLNEAIASFAAFRGSMYVGTGIQCGGYDRFHNVGPGAAEIIRIHPDDSWDLVMGEPRMTRRGLAVPSSGLGPGFDNPCTGYIWRLTAHDGALYAGTFDGLTFALFARSSMWPEATQRLLDRLTLERFLKMLGGCELWRTTTGDDWAPVTRNGFGSPFNWGIRALLSTPYGLFVGTANPFGPQVAVRSPSGWHYEPNPRGGTEIWHGSFAHAGWGLASGKALDGPGPYAGAGSDGAIPCHTLADLTPIAADVEALLHLGEGGDEGGDLPHVLADLACPEEVLEQHRRFAPAEFEARRDRAGRAHPLRRLATGPKDLIGLTEEVADELAIYFEGDWRGVGYWRDEGVSPRQAGEQLLVELLALLPDPAEGAPRSILAIGTGAAGLKAPLSRLSLNATVTTPADNPDGSAMLPAAAFDAVVWVEGPSAVDRPRALRRVGHALKPGGWLLAADLIGSPLHREDLLRRDTDTALLVRSYEQDLRAAGLVDGRILEVTRETWERFYRHSREYFGAKLLFQQIDQEQHARILEALPGGGLVVATYLLVSARKPRDG